MIKLVYCITTKTGMTDEEFFRYWENIHGPVGARIPRLRRLVQSHRVVNEKVLYKSVDSIRPNGSFPLSRR